MPDGRAFISFGGQKSKHDAFHGYLNAMEQESAPACLSEAKAMADLLATTIVIVSKLPEPQCRVISCSARAEPIVIWYDAGHSRYTWQQLFDGRKHHDAALEAPFNDIFVMCCAF